MLKKICVLVIILQLVTFPVYAQDYNALRKLARGTSNVICGWTELFRQMSKVGEEEGYAAGFFWGLFKGLACTIGRSLAGAYEIATFIIPPYRPVVKPEFVLSDM